MTEPSIAIKWLLLSNLKNRWLYSTNIRQEAADAALQWATDNGLANNGGITGSGEVWLMVNDGKDVEANP